MVDRCSKVIITGVDYQYILKSGNTLKLKCYNADTGKSFKFCFPQGDLRIKEFLVLLHVKSTNELWNKEFQIMYFDNHIYGISSVGAPEDVKYIPCTPSNETLITDPINKLLTYSAMEAFIRDYSRNDKPYYVEMF